MPYSSESPPDDSEGYWKGLEYQTSQSLLRMTLRVLDLNLNLVGDNTDQGVIIENRGQDRSRFFYASLLRFLYAQSYSLKTLSKKGLEYQTPQSLLRMTLRVIRLIERSLDVNI